MTEEKSIEQKIISVSAKAFWGVVWSIALAAFALGGIFNNMLYRIDKIEQWQSSIAVLADSRDDRIKTLENYIPLFKDNFNRLFIMVDKNNDRLDVIIREIRRQDDTL